jgi:Protein of unknown function (DUF1553)/Protein of unknown function (DUF1549)/Planctomycete cytochrome C/Concanavalin A-like lectin/glucanases superfamily
MKAIAALILTIWFASTLSAQSPEQIEFFESRIRPILAQECYACHSTATKSEGSLLLDSRAGWKAGGDNGETIKPGNPKESLLIQAIKHTHDDLKMPKQGAKLDDRTIADFERWIHDGATDPRDAPPSKDQFEKETSWSATLARRALWWSLKPLSLKPAQELSPQAIAHEIDLLIERKIAEQGLQPAEQADETVLRRRLSFTLTGLPPNELLKTSGGNASFEVLVHKLVDSPHFGEKWARHFMDWVRYAETYGSEGDPAIPYAWRYRDYLIRAFNDDVRWPQMIREALAGDLLPNPRIKDGINESAIGIGQLRMVLHGFSPVDSLDEQVAFTDNQIDTVTKAFQAFTVSCARCHNHKFDAISQTDFYAMYGIFTSTHPAVIDANAPGSGDAIRNDLDRIKTEIKSTLIKDWLANLPKESNANPSANALDKSVDENKVKSFEFRGGQRIKAGEFSIHGKVLRIHPSGFLSSLHSEKDRAVAITDRFPCDGGTLWVRVAGKGGAKAKYVVQNYPRTGTVHRAIDLNDDKTENLAWRSLDLNFWKGDEIFLQVATAADMPAEHKADGPSWFMLTDAVITQDSKPPANPAASSLSPRGLVEAWQNNLLSDSDAEALDALLQNKTLATDSVESLLEKYREIEQSLPTPTRVPGVIEADAKDAPMFVQGDHKKPGDVVQRRFLEVLDPQPFQTTNSGRLELAERIADMQKNPLTARVIVNRLWHHVFGRGLVPSVDNFGKLGDLPSHPELLDLLAQRFVDSGGSIKHLLKAMVLTKTFRRSSQAAPANAALDSENRMLSHFPLRRLEAESIRDSIVALTGKFDSKLYGQPIDSNVERRSVYVNVIRNKLDPFLTTFDAPVPFSTRGKRDSTNVPAQSLSLLNDPNVIRWSKEWARRLSQTENTELRIRQMFREAFAREAKEGEVKQCENYVKSMLASFEVKKQARVEQENKLAQVNTEIANIIEPSREALRAALKSGASIGSDGSSPSKNAAPIPLAEWTFDSDARDSRGNLHLTLIGEARLDGGALVLNGKSMAQSGSPKKRLKEKTLEAWVMLDNLNQQGGGVVTVQEMDGGLFDSIVFGELQAGHWLAGSNNHVRTQHFEGKSETETTKRPVHVAVVYHADGNISGYRDGLPYGRTYSKARGAVFKPELSQVLLGCRHGDTSGNRGLQGRIYRARLYDRALTAEEIATTALAEDSSITDAKVFESLTGLQREKIFGLQRERDTLAKANEASRSSDNLDEPELQAWSSLAQSLINLKEFIYLP